MYFWRINALKEELRSDRLPDKEAFKYLLASVIVYSAAVIPFPENNRFDTYLAITDGLISVLGVVYIFICNDGSNGRDFLQRFFSIGWVFGIRFFALFTLPVLIFYVAGLALFEEAYEETTLFDIVLTGVLDVTFFWKFGEHTKSVSGAENGPKLG